VELKCKKPIVSRTGNIIFYAGTVYKVLQQSASGQLMVKDETGCLRWLVKASGEAGKFLKENFEEIKGE
jgi:hypothetical protein